jgi:hypothetical protein
MLQATFTGENKLKAISMIFDVMGFMQELRRWSGRPGFRVTPNTLSTAEDPSDEPRIITSPTLPFRVQSINAAWSGLYGLNPLEVRGKTLVLESGNPSPVGQGGPGGPTMGADGGGGRGPGGPGGQGGQGQGDNMGVGGNGGSGAAPGAGAGAGAGTDPTVTKLYDALSRQLPCAVVVHYQTKHRGPICGRLRMYPLTSGTQLTHFLGILDPLQDYSYPTEAPPVLVFR